MRFLFIILFLASCSSSQKLHQGVGWQRDLLLLHKKNDEKVLDVLFAEIERAYHLQVDERLSRLMLLHTQMSEVQAKKLLTQALAQKDKITKALAEKKQELKVMPALDMALGINRAMFALTQAQSARDEELQSLIGKERLKTLESYTRKIPDLNKFLD